jgi:hypothetical protein
VYDGGRHFALSPVETPAANMLEELRRKITAELASVAFSATINLRSFSEGNRWLMKNAL